MNSFSGRLGGLCTLLQASELSSRLVELSGTDRQGKHRAITMRILMVAESATVHTHRWAHFFQDRGDTVLVVSQTADPIAGIQVVQFPPSDSWWSPSSAPAVWRWMATLARRLAELATTPGEAYNPDIVHIHYLTADVRNYFYYRGVSGLVVSAYGSDVVFDKGNPRPENPGDSFTAATGKRDYSHNPLSKDRDGTSLPKNRSIHVIPFGVDCSKFYPTNQLRRPGAPIVIGFVKHLEEKYGPKVLIEAFFRLNGKMPDTRMVIAGAGTQETELKALVEELNLGDHIEFVGRVAHQRVPELLRSFDIFAMPSVFDSETFGVSAIEASACQLPVVASHVGGVPEAVIHNRTGILVPPGDSEILASALLKLAQSRVLRERLGAAGRQFVLENYRWEENASRMAMIYDSLQPKPPESD